MAEAAAATANDYKAIVCVFFTAAMIMPTRWCRTMRQLQRYYNLRPRWPISRAR
jgi:hypothetical protein